jgi:hypothetical protein
VGALLIVMQRSIARAPIGRDEIVEDRLIEQFVTHAAVERFAGPVLHRFSGGNEMPSDPTVLSPGEHNVGGELGSMVGDDQIGFAAPGDDRVEFAPHPPAGD